MNVFSYLYNQFTSRLWHQTPPLEPPVYRLPVNAQPPENTPKFTHPPLESSSGQIRLLKISPGDFNDIITCTLNIFDTSIAPESRPHEYIALSYTWGPASPTRQILVNSGTAIVRQNLWEFLVVARELIPDQLVWIDQICINQEDNDDKNHQVRLMSKIYRRASSVIVWLGSPTNDSDLAMDFISRRAFDMTYSIPKRLRNAIRSFFFRPYWSRLWVVQEIKLAQSVTVLCGKKQLPLLLVKQFVREHMRIRHNELRLISPNAQALILGKEIIYVKRLSTMFLYGDMGSSDFTSPSSASQILRHNIFLYCDFKCADPRDKVYGFLGLLPDDELDNGASIAVDYNKTVEEVFWDFFTSSLLHFFQTRHPHDGSLPADPLPEWLKFGATLMAQMHIYSREKEQAIRNMLNETNEKFGERFYRIMDDDERARLEYMRLRDRLSRRARYLPPI